MIVIAGAGAGGFVTAKALRVFGFTGRILLAGPTSTGRLPQRAQTLWGNSMKVIEALGVDTEKYKDSTFMTIAGYKCKRGDWLVQPSKPLSADSHPRALFLKEVNHLQST